MTRRIPRPVLLAFGLLAAASSLTLTGCDDPFEPLIWANFPDTADLHSLARPEYVDRAGAYSILPNDRGARIVERLSVNPYGFDFAVSEDAEGNFLLLPTGVFPNAPAQAGIQVDSIATFDELSRAPRDGYITEETVPAETGGVYVLRSRQLSNGCFYYGKMEVIALDPAGIATVRVLANINCSDRSLVPNAPVDDDEDEGTDEGEGEA